MTTQKNIVIALAVAGIVLAAVVILVVPVPVQAATPTYYLRFVVNFYDQDIFRCIDEGYLRGSDAYIDPKTGEHNVLFNKVTFEDPNKAQYIFLLPFDPNKLTTHTGLIRVYLLLEQNEQVVYKDYKHPYTPFDPKRTQYSFTFNVRTDLGCGVSQLQSDSKLQSQEQVPHLRVLKVPKGDQNRE